MSDTILITGSCGFIGFHLAKICLEQGFSVVGIDNISPYYDQNLKLDRNKILLRYSNYIFIKDDISNSSLNSLLEKYELSIIVHLAAQAGVRYSIDNPSSYVSTNLVGTANILELARRKNIQHLLIASTSSAYGANTDMPFYEIQKCAHPLSFYAATKQSNELMAHSYSHLFKIPVTAFRFFTVYGPWGRPDMALFKFTKSILNNQPIDVYNFGKMQRDFTYIDDLVLSISKLLKVIPNEKEDAYGDSDSISPVAPMRVVNIGNASPVPLMKYVEAVENALEKKAKINYLPIQPGDVEETFADVTLLEKLTSYVPSTKIEDGVKSFINWYISYYVDK